MANRKGFTLAELIIAIVLIGVAVVVALQFLVYCQRLALIPDMRLRAANFAQETMEAIYMDDYTALVAPSDTALPTGGDNGRLRDQYGGTRTCTITAKTDYKVVNVTVQWNQ